MFSIRSHAKAVRMTNVFRGPANEVFTEVGYSSTNRFWNTDPWEVAARYNFNSRLKRNPEFADILSTLQDEPAARRELTRCLGLPGFRGILLYTNLAGAWCDEAPFLWLYARAEELGLPILLHPAKPLTTDAVSGYELTGTLGNMFEDTIALARIIASGLLDRHPDLKLVCPHLGGALPYLCGRMDHQVRVLKRGPQHLRKKPSDYLRDIFMDIVSPLPEALRFALDFTSADKLLFASDHPWVDAAEILGTLEQVGLPAETKAQILGGNARRLFKL